MATPTYEMTFHFFPKLSPELQLLIWECAAIPEPRELVVTVVKSNDETYNSPTFCFKPVTPSPAILQACHDSRVAALKNYTYKIIKNGNKNGVVERQMYANPGLDTITIINIDLEGYNIRYCHVEGNDHRGLELTNSQPDGTFSWICRVGHLPIAYRSRYASTTPTGVRRWPAQLNCRLQYSYDKK